MEALQTSAPRACAVTRIVIHRPAKDRELLDEGLTLGALFVADVREDLEALLARARALRAWPRYLLRLAPRAAEAAQRNVRARDLVVIGTVGAYNWNAASAWAGPVPSLELLRS